MVGGGPEDTDDDERPHYIGGFEYLAGIADPRFGSEVAFELPGAGCETGVQRGDSGGALVQRERLVGVISNGASYEPCSELDFAFVFRNDPTSNKLRQALRDEAETQCGTVDKL